MFPFCIWYNHSNPKQLKSHFKHNIQIARAVLETSAPLQLFKLNFHYMWQYRWPPYVSWYYFGINYFHLYNDIGSFWFDCAQITNNNTPLSSVHDRGLGVSEPSHILPKVSIKFEFKLLQYLILLSWFKLYTLRQLQN